MPKHFIRQGAVSVLFVFCLMASLGAHAGGPKHPKLVCKTCNLNGATTATVGSASQYVLMGGTTAGWTVSNGATILYSTSSTVEVQFNNTGTTNIETAGATCGGASINVTVTVAPLTSPSISTSTGTINYGATPGAISSSGASGGSCGGSYSYAWYYSTDDVNWNLISGASGLSYQPGALYQTTYYKQVVTCGSSNATSNILTITVYPQLAGGNISPTNQTINYGAAASTLTLSGVSGGSGSYTYQWQSSSNSSFSSPTNVGSGGTTYSPGALTSTTYYRVAVTSNGVTSYSTSAIINVYPQLSGGSVSASTQTINYNTVPSTLTLSGVSGGSGSYTYQWQSSPNSSFSSPTNVGSGGTTYSPGALTSTTYYRVAVTSNGVTSYSSTAVVNVYAQLVGGSISPSSQTINYNTAPSTLTLSGVSGGSGSYTYQWKSSPDNSTWTAISGQTSSSYSPPALTATTYYECVITSNGASVTTAAATVTVYPQLQAGSITPASQSINNGDGAATLTLSGVSGGNGSYSYQWMSSPDNSTWTAISGATTTTYSPNAPSATTYYEVIVTSNGATANSASASITVYPALNAGSINPGFMVVNYGGNSSLMTLTGVSGGNGSYTYQWQWTTDFDTWMNIDGATGTTCTLTGLTQNVYVEVLVTSNGDTYYSDPTYIEVLPPLTGGSVSPATQTINYNTIPAAIVVNDDATGGSGLASYTYQWQSSPDNSTWTNISGQTGKSYFPPALTATTYYRVTVSSNGYPAYSSPAVVNVYPQLQAGTLSPASQTITSGSPATISLSGTTGGNGTYTYQWQNSFDNTSWTNINGQTGTTYAPPLVSPGVSYRVMVTSNGVTVYTAPANVTVTEPLAGGTITGPSGVIGYNSSPGTLGSTQDAYGGACYPGDYRYQWQYSTDGSTFNNLPGATGNTYTPAAVTVPMYFRRQVTCGTTTTNSNTVYVQVASGPQSNCTAPH